MDNEKLESGLNRLRKSMDKMPSRTDKSAILKSIEQRKNKKSRFMVFGGSLASLIIISLLLLSSIGDFDLNQFGSGSDSGGDPLIMTDASVDIHSDESRTGSMTITYGEMKGEKIIPTVLEYEFFIKNISNETLGTIKWADEEDKLDFNQENGLQYKIEPSEQLKEVMKEVMGFNIFSEDDRAENRIGGGFSGTPMLESNQKRDFSMHFTLGATKENPELPLVPSQEELDKLEKNASNADLVVTLKGEEIARFDLREYMD